MNVLFPEFECFYCKDNLGNGDIEHSCAKTPRLKINKENIMSNVGKDYQYCQNIRVEIEEFEYTIRQANSKITVLKDKLLRMEERCIHIWETKPNTIRMVPNSYTTLGTFTIAGVDLYSGKTEIETSMKEVQVHHRYCSNCGKNEETIKTIEVKTIDIVPDWR